MEAFLRARSERNPFMPDLMIIITLAVAAYIGLGILCRRFFPHMDYKVQKMIKYGIVAIAMIAGLFCGMKASSRL